MQGHSQPVPFCLITGSEISLSHRIPHTMKEFFADGRPHDGLSYTEYREEWKEQTKTSLADVDSSTRQKLHYLNANWERQSHVHDVYTPSEELQEALASIDAPQLWMVLTEPWCGYSAFLLPVIAEAAARSPAVTLRLLYRDDNLDIMDQYLTGESRSIPKLVAFSEEGEELFTWGPRPNGARQTFEELRDTYDDKMTVIEGLIEYYEDGGWRETDDELARAIQLATPVSYTD